MWSWNFAKQAGERAVRAFASSLLSVWTVGPAFDVIHANWSGALSVAGGAAVVSLLTSVVASGVGQKGTASLVTITPTPPGPPPADGGTYAGRIAGGTRY
jgi:Putative lactococcus lactis phage r1t holin